MGNRAKPYEEIEVRKAVASSNNWSQALEKLGRLPRGNADQSLKNFTSKHGISTEHFTNAPSPPGKRLDDNEYFVFGVYRKTSSLKSRLLKTGKVPYICAICGSNPKWKGEEIVFWLDHIDGNPVNNQIENLRFVCPNCAAQLDTHGSKNSRAKKDKEKEEKSSRAYSYQPEGTGERIKTKTHITFGIMETSKKKFAAIVKKQKTLSDVVRQCGGDPEPSNIRKARRYADAWDLSIEHFDVNVNQKTVNKKTREQVTEQYLKKDVRVSSNRLKHWLWEFEMLERKCSACQLGEEWKGKHIALHLDHISGDSKDNRLENLRILCPNCHSQTDTFAGGAKRGTGKKKTSAQRKCLQCKKNFVSTTRIYCSDECNKAGFKKNASLSHIGKAQTNRRKVERPPLEEVRAYAEQHGYCAAGRRWGVSDNAVRKWLRRGIQ